MKAYRYNSKKREDRRFNRTGKEKNPNALKYYAKSLDYAENYRFVYYEDGVINYECELEVLDLDDKLNLFNMYEDYAYLTTYKNYIEVKITIQRNDYIRNKDNAKSAKMRKFWESEIKNLDNRELELVQILKEQEFQSLSDYEMQDSLLKELKTLGFEGYETKNEIVLM